MEIILFVWNNSEKRSMKKSKWLIEGIEDNAITM